MNLTLSINRMNNNINGLFLFQQFATAEMHKLKSGEGISNRGGQSKFELSKFRGEDVEGWLYRVQQFF